MTEHEVQSAILEYLALSGTTAAVIDAHPCQKYWELTEATHAPRMTASQEGRAHLAIVAHLDKCQTCRAWMDALQAVHKANEGT